MASADPIDRIGVNSWRKTGRASEITSHVKSRISECFPCDSNQKYWKRFVLSGTNPERVSEIYFHKPGPKALDPGTRQRRFQKQWNGPLINNGTHRRWDPYPRVYVVSIKPPVSWAFSWRFVTSWCSVDLNIYLYNFLGKVTPMMALLFLVESRRHFLRVRDCRCNHQTAQSASVQAFIHRKRAPDDWYGSSVPTYLPKVRNQNHDAADTGLSDSVVQYLWDRVVFVRALGFENLQRNNDLNPTCFAERCIKRDTSNPRGLKRRYSGIEIRLSESGTVTFKHRPHRIHEEYSRIVTFDCCLEPWTYESDQSDQ